MGGPNGSGSHGVARSVQALVTVEEINRQIMMSMQLAVESIDNWLESVKNIINEVAYLIYAEVVRRGVAELFKVDK